MRIQFAAEDVRLDVVRADNGKFSPILAGARNGTVLIELTKAELQSLLMAFVQAALDEHGAKILSGDLNLSSAGDRAVRASLRVTVKKMLVNVTVTIEARAEVDEHLAVTISDFRVLGDGMVDSLVAGMLRARLESHEGRVFNLTPKALKNVKLSKLRIQSDELVQIVAAFEA